MGRHTPATRGRTLCVKKAIQCCSGKGFVLCGSPHTPYIILYTAKGSERGTGHYLLVNRGTGRGTRLFPGTPSGPRSRSPLVNRGTGRGTGNCLPRLADSIARPASPRNAREGSIQVLLWSCYENPYVFSHLRGWTGGNGLAENGCSQPAQ